MIDHILINPVNRLLGTAAGDLSLYGAQPGPNVVLAPATGGPVAATQPQLVMVERGAGTAPDSPPNDPLALSRSSEPVEVPGSGHLAPPAATILGQFDSASTHSALVPAPYSAPVSVAQFVSADPLSAPTLPLHQAAETDVLQPSELVASTQGLNPVAMPADAGDRDDNSPTSQADDILHSAQSVESIAQSAVDDAASLVGEAVEASFTVAGPLVDTLTETITAVGTSLDAPTSLIPDSLTNVAAGVEEILPAATVGPLSDTIGAAGDTATDLLGSDPSAGITTLVSLVTIGDMFDLRDAGSAGDADDDSGAGMLDTLAADLPADFLTGTDPDHDHHDSLLGLAGGDGDGGIGHPLGFG